MSIPPSVVGLWGGVASAKSSIAATFPGPIAWHSFDVGGLQRARVPEGQQVTLYEYPAPIKLDMLRKRANLEGWTELWASFLSNLVANLNSDCQTIVIDTGTRCWLACHRAYLQMKQEAAEAANKPIPEGLLQIEYGEVNPWMFQVLDAPKQRGKFLVLTAHDEEERQDQIVKGELKEGVVVLGPDGKPVMKPQGFRHLPKNADLMIRMVAEAGVPWGVITKSGLVTLKLEGARIKNPTFGKLEEVLEKAGQLEQLGLEVPRVWE